MGNTLKMHKKDDKFINYFNMILQQKDSIIENQYKLIETLQKESKEKIIYNDASTQTEDNIIDKKTNTQIFIEKEHKHIMDTTIDDDTEEIISSIQTIEKYDNTKKSKYPNRGKKWIDRDKLKLKEMYINEYDTDDMVIYFGRSKKALICELRRIIYTDYLKSNNKEEICEEYNITEEKLDEIIKKHTNSRYYKN
jgi:hypothetical protein